MKAGKLENWRNYLCILEVDLEYPKSLHDWQNDYPLAPEQIKINKIKKLIPNLEIRKNVYYNTKILNNTKFRIKN